MDYSRVLNLMKISYLAFVQVLWLKVIFPSHFPQTSSYLTPPIAQRENSKFIKTPQKSKSTYGQDVISEESRQIKFSFNSSLIDNSEGQSESRNSLDLEEEKGQDDGLNHSKFQENQVEAGDKDTVSEPSKSKSKSESGIGEQNSKELQRFITDFENKPWRELSVISKASRHQNSKKGSELRSTNKDMMSQKEIKSKNMG